MGQHVGHRHQEIGGQVPESEGGREGGKEGGREGRKGVNQTVMGRIRHEQRPG